MSDLRLFTSESVTEGHPDKICDQVSDSILDALLAQDRTARVAVETLVTTGLVHVAGEVTTSGYVDIPGIVRRRITDIGYVQPHGLPDVMLRHGVFVLSSRSESWGVAVAEAMAAGMPVICTEAAGGIAELVRQYYNGLLAATEDPASLSQSLRWCHQNYQKLPEFGRRSVELAAPFSAENWGLRWAEWMAELQSPSR